MFELLNLFVFKESQELHPSDFSFRDPTLVPQRSRCEGGLNTWEERKRSKTFVDRKEPNTGVVRQKLCSYKCRERRGRSVPGEEMDTTQRESEGKDSVFTNVTPGWV